MTGCEARLSLDEVTHGVTELGQHVPDTKNDAETLPLPPLIATITVESSGGFEKAMTETPAGAFVTSIR